MFALDTVVLAALYRVLAGVRIPPRHLFPAALLGAAALGVLKILGTVLLGAAGANPLLASFAVIIGLLIWFNLVCQVILLAAAWFIVSMIDAGHPLDEVAAKERQANGRPRSARLSRPSCAPSSSRSSRRASSRACSGASRSGRRTQKKRSEQRAEAVGGLQVGSFSCLAPSASPR